MSIISTRPPLIDEVDHSWYEYIAEILCAVALAATCVSSIYYTIGVQVEAGVVSSNVDIVCEELVGDLVAYVSPSFIQENQSAIETALTLPPSVIAGFATADAQVEASNAALETQAFTVLACVLGCCVVIVICLNFVAKRRGSPFSLWRVLLKVLILTTVVGIVELSFLYGVGAHYQSASGNQVKYQFVTSVIEYGNS